MKKLTILIVVCITLLLSGCTVKSETATYIVSGTIVDIHHLYSTDIVIETNDGIKIPVHERRYSDFSYGLEVGDKVCFEVKKVDGTGYEIIGFGFESNHIKE